MTKQSTTTRKQLAPRIGMCIRTIERREVEWGLDKCRTTAPQVPVTYFKYKAERQLISKGIAVKPE